jgi:hypothetical protein
MLFHACFQINETKTLILPNSVSDVGLFLHPEDRES